MYDFDALRPLHYSRQAVDSRFARQSTIIEDYNRMLAAGETAGSDLEAFDFLRRRAAGSAVLDSEIWTLDEAFRSRPEISYTIHKTGTFRRFLIKLSADPAATSGLIALYPNRHQDDPPLIDRCNMEVLAPHLGKALEVSRITQALRFHYKAALAALDMIDVAICLLDTYGHVLLKNRRADELFSLQDGIWVDRSGRLQCRSEDTGQALRQAVVSACLLAEGENRNPVQEVEIPRASSTVPLFAIASALRDADIELEPGLTGAFLTIVDGTRSLTPEIDRMSAAYRLTKAEARVALLIAGGLTNREISERVEVGTETVKSQVSSILRKTGCRHRLEFVWRLYQFSPPIL